MRIHSHVYRRLALIIGGVAIGFACPATAQVRPIQGGNVLDANMMVGSGGINTPVSSSWRFGQASAIIAGNVGGGAQFRGFSPIRDSSSLFIDLPSSSLSSFRASSISAGEVAHGFALNTPRLYYDPSRTVANAGAIESGLNRPGSSTPLSPFEIPRQNYQRRIGATTDSDLLTGNLPTGTGLAIEPSIERIDPRVLPGASLTTINPRLLSSPLFAGTYAVPASQLRYWGADEPLPRGFTERAAVVPIQRPPLEVVAGGANEVAQSPLDRVLRAEPLMGESRIDASVAERIDGRVYAPIEPPVAPEESTISPAGGEPAVLPPVPNPLAGIAPRPTPEQLGRDRFRDMQAAVVALNARAPGDGAAPDASDSLIGWARDYVIQPMTSFVGTYPTALNEYFRKAETAMHDGRYYDASASYELARAIDPDSPLPLLGRAQALIAAGEYRTASVLLSRAVEKFPGIVYFDIQLNQFIVDPLIRERRRADLERLLEVNDNCQLRFVLGWLEYFGGLPTAGLETFVKAAAKAPPGSTIARMPELLKRRMSLPLVPGAPRAGAPTAPPGAGTSAASPDAAAPAR